MRRTTAVYSQRTVQFWRTAEPRPGVLRATGQAGVVVMLDRPVGGAGVRIDGRSWTSFSWYCHRQHFELPVPGVAELGFARRLIRRLRGHRSSKRVWLAGSVLDLAELPSGSHRLEVLPEDGSAWSLLLERLPG